MRIQIAAAAVTLLTACSTVHHEAGDKLSETTAKSAEAYAACLAPKWQAFVPTATSTATADGWKVAAGAPFTGEQAIATIVNQGTGAKVTVYLPPAWAETTAWTNMAQECL
jgi:hypothetical protein